MPKRRQQLKKNKKIFNFKSLILVFLCLVLLVLFFFLFSIKASIFSSQESFSLVFIDKEGKIVLSSYSGPDLGGSYFYIPKNIKFDSSKDLGSYSVASLYPLGVQQGIGGGVLVKNTLQENLFIPIDAYLYSNKDFSFDKENKLGGELKKIFLQSLLLRADTDLSYFDRLKIFYFFINQKSSDWDYYDLINYASEIDGESSFFKLKDQLISDTLFYSFADKRFIDSQKTVGIINLGSCDNAASHTLSLLNNMGQHAVIFPSEESGVELTNLSFKINDRDLAKSKFSKRLKRIFNIKKEILTDFSQRADILLEIGSDYCKLPK